MGRRKLEQRRHLQCISWFGSKLKICNVTDLRCNLLSLGSWHLVQRMAEETHGKSKVSKRLYLWANQKYPGSSKIWWRMLKDIALGWGILLSGLREGAACYRWGLGESQLWLTDLGYVNFSLLQGSFLRFCMVLFICMPNYAWQKMLTRKFAPQSSFRGDGLPLNTIQVTLSLRLPVPCLSMSITE